MEVNTQQYEYCLFWDSVFDAYVVTVREDGGLGKVIFKDEKFGVAGRFFMERINLDKAHIEYSESEKRKA